MCQVTRKTYLYNYIRDQVVNKGWHPLMIDQFHRRLLLLVFSIAKQTVYGNFDPP